MRLARVPRFTLAFVPGLGIALATAPGQAVALHAQHRMADGVDLSVEDEPVAKALTLRLGPFDLPARSRHTAVSRPPERFLSIPFDGRLLAYHPRLADREGVHALTTSTDWRSSPALSQKPLFSIQEKGLVDDQGKPISEEEIRARMRSGTAGAILRGVLGAGVGVGVGFLGGLVFCPGGNGYCEGDEATIGFVILGLMLVGTTGGAFLGHSIGEISREEAIQGIKEERRRTVPVRSPAGSASVIRWGEHVYPFGGVSGG